MHCRRIDKLRKTLEKGATPATLSTAGTARFLDFPDGHGAINEDKIVKAAAWDGLRGIIAQDCLRGAAMRPIPTT